MVNCRVEQKYILYQNRHFPIALNVIEWSKNVAIAVVKKLVTFGCYKNIILNFDKFLVNRVDITGVCNVQMLLR